MIRLKVAIIFISVFCASCSSSRLDLGNGYVYYDFGGENHYIKRERDRGGSYYDRTPAEIREADPSDPGLVWESWHDGHVVVEPVIQQFVNGPRFIIGRRARLNTDKSIYAYYGAEGRPRPNGYFIVDKHKHKVAYDMDETVALRILREEGYLPSSLGDFRHLYWKQIRKGGAVVQGLVDHWHGRS